MDGATSSETLSKEEMFRLLQNSRRRHVLQYLIDSDGAVQIGDVSEQIAAWESGTSVADITPQQRQRVYIALYQSHLPKLASADLITYNQSKGIIEGTPKIDRITPYLDRDETPAQSNDATRKWVRYYAGVTVISLLLIGLTWADVGIISQVGSGRLGLIITLLYASVTVAMAVDSY
ncbi:DUF7344 domain-containing protein [Halalkalicoccus salilacus]|uniref:DUF7344 domain-containing protein n=1 Tax=Halalkalicoccus salilacus TaxID=3117459 RepID=UPI00300F55E8